MTRDWTKGRFAPRGPSALGRHGALGGRATSIRGMADAAGIVLAGGRSSRMGSPKAALEWHGSTLLRRVCGIVGRAVYGPIVVVRAPGQALPALPDSIEVVEDAGHFVQHDAAERVNALLASFLGPRIGTSSPRASTGR